jgi:hypothetical protein
MSITAAWVGLGGGVGVVDHHQLLVGVVIELARYSLSGPALSNS